MCSGANRAALEEVGQIQIPALSIGGWFDLFLGGTLRAYKRMREDGATADVRDGQRLVIGPWSHANMTGLFPERSFGLQATPRPRAHGRIPELLRPLATWQPK